MQMCIMIYPHNLVYNKLGYRIQCKTVGLIKGQWMINSLQIGRRCYNEICAYIWIFRSMIMLSVSILFFHAIRILLNYVSFAAVGKDLHILCFGSNKKSWIYLNAPFHYLAQSIFPISSKIVWGPMPSFDPKLLHPFSHMS